MRYKSWRRGITVVFGPMFAGKTDWLIKKAQGVQRRGLRIQVFKPRIDTRYGGKSELVAHNGRRLPATLVTSAKVLLHLVNKNTQIVFIDEGQFFDKALVRVCRKLAKRGIRVVVAGLDKDFRRMGFGPMPALVRLAGKRVRLFSNCDMSGCKRPADYTQRIITGKPAPFNAPVVHVGEKDAYQARCRRHHKVPCKNLWQWLRVITH